MCEVCKSEGRDYLFVNGTKSYIYTNNFYKVFKQSVASAKLCYVHSIELFTIGEKRFLQGHLPFARKLATRSRNMSSEETPFGF